MHTMPLSINRSITRLCLIACFFIFVSLLIAPVESQRSARKAASKHSRLPIVSEPVVDTISDVISDQPIAQSINQSNDQSVELQPASQSIHTAELGQSNDEPKAQQSELPSAIQPHESNDEHVFSQALKTQGKRQSKHSIQSKPRSEQPVTDVSEMQSEQPLSPRRTIEAPSTHVKRQRKKSIYQSLQQKVFRHQHSADEDVPVATFDEDKVDLTVKKTIYPANARGSIQSGHSDHDSTDQPTEQAQSNPSLKDQPEKHYSAQSVSQVAEQLDSQAAQQLAGQVTEQPVDQATNQPLQPAPLPVQPADQPIQPAQCLDDQTVRQIKQRTKSELKDIMGHYQAIWALEGKSDAVIDELIAGKSKELIRVLRAKKTELAKQACSKSSSVESEPSSAQSDNVISNNPSVDQLVSQSNEAPADLVAGGVKRRLLSFDEISLIETEDDEDEDDDNRVYVSSIHPYHEPSAPSAFTELSERDIASRHELMESMDESVNENDDDFGPGFRATITPTRLSELEISTLASRSASDIEEELTQEKLRRLERLKARRGIVIASILPVSESQSPPDEQQHPIGHYVASIKPQHSSPIFEEDEMTQAYKSKSFKPVRAGIHAPQKQNEELQAPPKPKIEREWMKSEKMSSRSRLSKMVRGE